MHTSLLASLREHLPNHWRNEFDRRLYRLRRPAWLGTIRRTTPISDAWGYDRGTPIDRYYIKEFLDAHRQDICGRVLEIKDSGYTDRYGVGVTRCDVLDIDPSNSRATIVADLASGGIGANQFDCFVLTQTLQFIYDTRAVLKQAYRLLRPGGVLLVTVPAVSRLDRRLADYWRFTVASCSALFGEIFGPAHITVRSYGNVLASIAFLTGMSAEELSRSELDAHAQHFPVIVAVRAMKPLGEEHEP